MTVSELLRADDPIPTITASQAPRRSAQRRTLQADRRPVQWLLCSAGERGNRLPAALNPDKTYAGGQTISVSAETHQLPLFIRVGSSVKLGNLNQLWLESVEIARKKPDLRTLEASVKSWFEKQR